VVMGTMDQPLQHHQHHQKSNQAIIRCFGYYDDDSRFVELNVP